MCTCKTAIRRRKQALKNYRHMAPLRRPKFNKVSAEKSANRLHRVIMGEKMRQQRKGQKR